MSSSSVADSIEAIEKIHEIETESKDSNQREQWTSSLDFFFSALGYAVGIGI